MVVNNPKSLNRQQALLGKALEGERSHAAAIALFLKHHGSLHAKCISEEDVWSYPDQITSGLQEAEFRITPNGFEHSIAWCFWHLARIEDIAMNILVARRPQVYMKGGWQEKLAIPFRDSGNTPSQSYLQLLNHEIDIPQLLQYRESVGRETRVIVQNLSSQRLAEKVAAQDIESVLASGAISVEARAVADYWSRRTIRGLLLMPASRHIIVHLNEAARIKKKVMQG